MCWVFSTRADHRQKIDQTTSGIETTFYFIQKTWYKPLEDLAPTLRNYDVIVANSAWWDIQRGGGEDKCISKGMYEKARGAQKTRCDAVPRKGPGEAVVLRDHRDPLSSDLDAAGPALEAAGAAVSASTTYDVARSVGASAHIRPRRGRGVSPNPPVVPPQTSD